MDKKKIILFSIVLLTLTLVTIAVIKSNKQVVYKTGTSAIFDNALAAANNLYRNRVSEGMDLSKGPCLSNDLMPGWVVDTVHSPREAVDDLSENQCAAFLEGRANHFIELDLNGNLVSIK